MRILHKILTAVVTQLQTRGGVLYEDAAYWLKDLEKASAEGPDLAGRLAAVEEKIEYLAEHVGLRAPDDPGPVVEEILVGGDRVEGFDDDEDDYDYDG